LEGKPTVLPGEFVGTVYLVIACITERRFVSAAEDRGLFMATDITLDLHLNLYDLGIILERREKRINERGIIMGQ
jgi:hypothetical protein